MHNRLEPTQLTADRGAYLTDRDGVKYLDFTSGNGHFPCGYDPLNFSEISPAADFNNLASISFKLSDHLEQRYFFRFFSCRTEAMFYLYHLLKDQAGISHFFVADNSLIPFFPGCHPFHISSDSASARHLSEVSVSWNFSLKSTAAVLSGISFSPEMKKPDQDSVSALIEKTTVLYNENLYCFMRNGNLFSFKNIWPQIVSGGENWASGLPFYFLAFRKGSFSEDIPGTVPPSPLIMSQVEKNINFLTSEINLRKIAFFENRMTRFSRLPGVRLYSTGFLCVMTMENTISEKVLARCLSSGLFLSSDPGGNGILIAPPFSASEEEILQGLDILWDIVQKN